MNERTKRNLPVFLIFLSLVWSIYSEHSATLTQAVSVAILLCIIPAFILEKLTINNPLKKGIALTLFGVYTVIITLLFIRSIVRTWKAFIIGGAIIMLGGICYMLRPLVSKRATLDDVP